MAGVVSSVTANMTGLNKEHTAAITAFTGTFAAINGIGQSLKGMIGQGIASSIASQKQTKAVATNTQAFAANTNNDIATGRYSYISALNTSGVNGQALIFATNETGNSAVERLRIASTGVSTFTVSGNDTRLANFSTVTYGSTRGLRINSYQSSNGGQDCAIEFDSGIAGYGGFKLSNSGTPMLTLVATGAATFSNSVTAENGIYVRSGGSFGTTMALATSDSYAAGSKVSLFIELFV